MASYSYNVVIVGEEFSPTNIELSVPVRKGDIISVVEGNELTFPDDSAEFEVVGITHIVNESLTERCDPYLYVERVEEDDDE